jgi:hypothetical protein
MDILMIIGLSILVVVLQFWAIIDITKSRFIDPKMRTLWLIAVLLLPMLGSILYFQLRKMLTSKEPRTFQPNFNRPN